MKALLRLRQLAFLVVLVAASAPAAAKENFGCPAHWCGESGPAGRYYQYLGSACSNIWCQCTYVTRCSSGPDISYNVCACGVWQD